MSKKNFLLIICLIILVTALILRLTTKEDDWVCSGGQWTKHGQPSDSMPSTPCPKSQSAESVVELETVEELGAPIVAPLISNEENNSSGRLVLGGDRDEHGCIGSAGASWCEAKGKCLRVWEEVCAPLTSISDISVDSEATVSLPASGAVVTSPLLIKGQAKGTWFFEANIPLKLVDENGLVLARVGASALSDWMTTEMVPFQGELIFETPQAATGYLIISKDNPSGLPENDASLKMLVKFK